MRQLAVLIGLTLAFAVQAQERGLAVAADALDSARFQARFERDASSALPLRSSGALALNAASQQVRLLGDYQFDSLRLGATGGVRVTGGLLINLRNNGLQAANLEPSPTLPYAGIGYASGGAVWGFSADLGLAAGGLGVSLGNRGALGLGLDGGLRDLRLQPMLRLGMNLAF